MTAEVPLALDSTVDLTAELGVSAQLDLVDGSIAFGVSVGEVHERFLGELADLGVLAAPDAWPSDAFAKAVTRIYRRLDDDRVLTLQGLAPGDANRGVKLDVTVVSPLGYLKSPQRDDEYPKTIGHFHTVLEHEGVPSPDLYQVVWGEGLVLGQSSDANGVKSVAIQVSCGDTLLLPPHIGHLTINTGPTPLVFANVCVRCPHLSYAEHVQYGGGSWLFFLGADHEVVARPNERLLAAGVRLDELAAAVPSRSTLASLGLERGEPISAIIDRAGDALSLLERPSHHLKLFANTLERRRE